MLSSACASIRIPEPPPDCAEGDIVRYGDGDGASRRGQVHVAVKLAINSNTLTLESVNMQEDVTDMELRDTVDNGESVVQIAGIGRVVGSDVDGNPIEQELDEESLKKLADKLNASGREVLVDRDHSSSKPGLDRDTSAQGWASEFEVREGKGLFGKVKWSDVGRKLVENRVFRWLSPVFRIGKDRKPVDMQAIALTNTPSQPLLKPVLNQAADGEQIENTEKAEGLEMNVEDIRKIVFEVLNETGLAVDGKAVVAEEIKKEIAEEKLDKLEDEAEMKAAEAIVE